MKKTIKIKVSGCENGYLHGVVLSNQAVPIGTVCVLSWTDTARPRTLNQNSLYWLFMNFVRPYLAEGDPTITPEEIHESMKALFLPKILILRGPGGPRPLLSSKTTTKLSKSEFSNYFKSVQEYLGTFGVPVELFITQYQEYKEYWS